MLIVTVTSSGCNIYYSFIGAGWESQGLPILFMNDCADDQGEKCLERKVKNNWLE